MECPRPRTVQASVLGISLILLAALLLLMMGSVQAHGSQHRAQRSPGLLGWDYPATFVGQDHVDLKWEPDPYYPVWVLYRDDAELKRFDNTMTFYRDRSVTRGQTYTYKMCPQTGLRSCGVPSTVTVGQIRGILYEYVSWVGDTYQISGAVTVRPGATLHIGSGATVVGAWDAPIQDKYPFVPEVGAIQVDGATIRARLLLSSGSSWVADSTIGGESAGWVYLSSWTGGALAGNTFTSTGVLNIYGAAGQDVTVHDNTFYAASLTASGAGEVVVEGNRFEKESSVRVEGTLTGAIAGNNFNDSSVTIYSSGYFDVRNNRLRCIETYTCGIGVGMHAPNVGIYGNLLDGFMNAPYGGEGVGISAGADQDAGGIVDIHDNVITELERGISLSGPIRVLIHSNTITHNRTGIYIKHWDAIADPNVTVADNCIAGNNRGQSTHYGGLAAVDLASVVGATGNYWGSPSGPTHPNNPGGTGDLIQELDDDWKPVVSGTVDFTGWLPAHHCSAVDLSVAGVEVVQSVQDLANSVPLVAGKPTVVRIYADSGAAPEVTGVPVQLEISRGGSLLATKQGTLTARPIVNWDQVRASTDGGLAVRLDSGWLTGTLNLAVMLNAGQGIDEPSFDNNQKTYTVTFAARNPIHVGLAPIEYQPLESAPPQAPLTEDLPSLVQFLHKSYPVAEVRATVLPRVSWHRMMKGSWHESPRSRQLLKELEMLWALFYRADAGPGERLDQIVGVFPADCEAGGDITGSRSYPRWAGGKGLASYVCSGDPVIVAHEVGHNLGLFHPCKLENAVQCCGAWHPGPPKAPPLDWPYANASIQEFGFDAFENAVVLPVTPELMTYCQPQWLSPHYYRKLFQANGLPQPPVTAPPGGGRQQAAAGPYLVIGGLVDVTGTVAFDPFWQLPADVPALTPEAGSDYCLEVRDAGGTVLHSRCFDLPFYDYEAGAAMAADSFLVTLPLDPAAGRVVLRHGAADLGQVAASDHAPQVTLVAPNRGGQQRGTLSVQWTVQDADPGAVLAFNLSYSNDDGATWQPFAINVTGTNSYELDLAGVPGGAACRVKVDASDGWHVASDTSDASFAVGGKAPVAGILAPADGAVVPAVPLTLEGYGYDLEDGLLADSALAWSSDVDGPLGSGGSVWDVTLSPGPHVLTLRVTDSQGASGSVSVVVTVEGGEPGPRHIYLPLVLRRIWP